MMRMMAMIMMKKIMMMKVIQTSAWHSPNNHMCP